MFNLGSVKKIDYKENVSKLYAHFQTNHGDFKVELFHDKAPETVWNFVNLAEGRQKTKREGNYFDGLTFHRIIDGFVIQGGCPQGNGRGGPGYKFDNEIHPDLSHGQEGILSMANAGPNTNGSQFFITLNDVSSLDGGYSIFGQVVEGIDIVKSIGKVRTGQSDFPIEKVEIEKVSIERIN
ncbi:MAG: peptidylprolyl isomerase [Halobacteriovoraceae bacterium]|nr:peptidylprolyl isomerase [Halobacteriovoraceae bacterium]